MQASNHGAVASPRASTRGGSIAIVGAGFCGTAVRDPLLRARGEPRRSHHARRSARGNRRRSRLRDARLSLSAQRRGRADVARRRRAPRLPRLRARQGIHAAAGDYLPRQVYGDYLRARLAEAARAAAGARVDCVTPRARAAAAAAATAGWELWLDDGSALRADDVVLALGNPPPACLPGLAPLAASGRYVAIPGASEPGAPGYRQRAAASAAASR